MHLFFLCIVMLVIIENFGNQCIFRFYLIGMVAKAYRK